MAPRPRRSKSYWPTTVTSLTGRSRRHLRCRYPRSPTWRRGSVTLGRPPRVAPPTRYAAGSCNCSSRSGRASAGQTLTGRQPSGGRRRRRWTKLPGWTSRGPTSYGSVSILAPRARYRSLPPAVGLTSLLWCALSMKNEPARVPESMGACMVAGFNNWDRIREYRRRWEAEGGDRSGTAWRREFKRLVPRKELYQDRFLILSDGPYSNVTAGEIGLSDTDWRRQSTMIRLEHECSHYFTLRVFGSMRNNLLDELIADYMGITAAAGRYRADWFLRFMGLESFPAYREGSRLQNYRGRPPLSEGAFGTLRALVRDIAENLQRVGDGLGFLPGSQEERAGMLLALCGFRLEDLAAPDAPVVLSEAIRRETEIFRDAANHPG